MCAGDTVRDQLGMAHVRHHAHCRWQIKALGDKKREEIVYVRGFETTEILCGGSRNAVLPPILAAELESLMAAS